MTINATKIFNFLRGAVRSAYGKEDFRGKKILLVGMENLGQELLTMLCLDDVELLFWDKGIMKYDKAHQICSSVGFLEETEDGIDILIHLIDGYVIVESNSKSKDFKICDISDDPYNQGIHEFYL